MSTNPSIRLTEEDFNHLSDLAEAYAAGGRPLPHLESELARAELLRGDVPSDIVTMNSTLEFEDVDSGARQKIQLVYPRDADIDKGRISIVTPVGSALLGLTVGQTIDWTLPDGRKRRYRVLSVSPATDEDRAKAAV